MTPDERTMRLYDQWQRARTACNGDLWKLAVAEFEALTEECAQIADSMDAPAVAAKIRELK